MLYDRCIRRFQTAAEREADGRSKGYSGVLEADLYRSEAKIAALKGQNENGSYIVSPTNTQSDIPFVSYVRGQNGQILPEEEDEVPKNREEGMERWKFEMTIKFLRGEDREFDYRDVDESEELDVLEAREEEERWFEDEEPEWVEDESGEDVPEDTIGKKKGDREKKAFEATGGETGIQDF